MFREPSIVPEIIVMCEQYSALLPCIGEDAIGCHQVAIFQAMAIRTKDTEKTR